MPNISWISLLIGVAIGAYLLPFITGLVRSQNSNA